MRANASAAMLVSHTPHVPELQSIRGIAALGVLIGHCIAYYATPPWWTFVKRLLNGQASVEIFFILSGFVLALSIVRKPIDRAAIGAFYVKRLFRIYPALIVASTLALAYVALLHYRIPVPGASKWIGERFRADRFHPIPLIASYAGMLAFLIPPVWTIFIEIVASLLMPPMAWLLARRRTIFFGLFAALVLISVGLGGLLYYRVDMYLMDFALGAALLTIDPAPLRRFAERGMPVKALVCIAALLFVCTRAFTSLDVWDPWIQLYEALLAAFVIFAFGRGVITSGLLRSRVMVWLGDISFSVYLLHFTIMCLWAKAIAVVAPSFVPSVGGVAAGVLVCIPTLIVTLPLATWTFRTIETPGIALGGTMIRRLARTPARPAVA